MGASILVHVVCSRGNQENVYDALKRWSVEGIVRNELWLSQTKGANDVFAIFTADEPNVIEAFAEAVPRYLQRRYYDEINSYPWMN